MAATPEPVKLNRPTFIVNYWDDKDNLTGSDIVKPMPFKGKNGQPSWSDLILLQEKLIHLAVYQTAHIGSFLQLPEGLDIIRKMAAMLIVVGKVERGINLDNLLDAGDYCQVGRIFLSEGFDESGIPPRPFIPSAIARIHGMDFEGKLDKEGTSWRQKMLVEKIEEAAEPAATQPTPPIKVMEEEEIVQGEIVAPVNMPRLAQVTPI